MRTVAGLNLILAPVVYLSGQLLLSRWTAKTPDSVWFLAHGLLWMGAGLYIFAVIGIERHFTHKKAFLIGVGQFLTIFGALGLIGQFTIDLAVGQLAVNQREMSVMFAAIQTAMGIHLAFYILAPVCFFLGLFALMLGLAISHQVPAWTGFVAAIGFVMIGVAVGTSSVAIFLFGFAAMGFGLAAVGWQVLRTGINNTAYLPFRYPDTENH